MDRLNFFDASRPVAAEGVVAPGHGPVADEPGEQARHVADMRATFVRSLLAWIRFLRMDPEPFTRGLGFSISDLDRPGCLLSFSQSARFARRVYDRLDDPHLGIRMGAAFNFVSWGPLALGVMACPTVQEAWRLMLAAQRDVGSMLQLSGQAHPYVFALSGQPRFPEPDLEPLFVGHTFAAILRASRDITRRDLAPLRVRLRWNAPSGADRYREVFGCPVLMGQPANVMEFSSEPMALPTSDPYTYRTMQALLQQTALRPEGRLDIAASVSRAIRNNIANPPDLQSLAADFHMSERTLRRHLAEAGCSYLQLLEEERQAHVFQQLQLSRRPVAEIAVEAGFADARSLRRAFRRWSGQTPADWRNAHLADDFLRWSKLSRSVPA